MKEMFLALILAITLTPLNTLASYVPQVSVTKSKATAIADNFDYITVTISPCATFDPEVGQEAITGGTWELTGTGTTVSSPTYIGFPEEPGSVSCGVAKVSWQAKSSTAGDKTLTIRGYGWPGLDYTGSTSVSFTAPATTTTTTTSSTPTATTRKPATTPAISPAASTAPTVPVLDKIIVGEKEVSGEEIKQTTEFKTEERKVFSGKTIPNGVVKLYFQSDPFEDTVTADAQGNWTYELKRDLGAGDHTLQVAVTDPATSLTSEKSAPVAFKIATAEAPKTETKAAKDWTWYYVGGTCLVFSTASNRSILPSR